MMAVTRSKKPDALSCSQVMPCLASQPSGSFQPVNQLSKRISVAKSVNCYDRRTAVIASEAKQSSAGAGKLRLENAHRDWSETPSKKSQRGWIASLRSQ